MNMSNNNEKLEDEDHGHGLTLGAGLRMVKLEAKFRFVWTIEKFSKKRQEGKNGKVIRQSKMCLVIIIIYFKDFLFKSVYHSRTR